MQVVTHFLRWAIGAAPAETQTSADERAAIARHARGRRALVEIGVWHGVTTSVIRRAMAADGVLYAVDPFPTGRLGVSLQQVIARREVARTPGGRVEWLRLTGRGAANVARARGLAPDFMFIDGDHSFDGLGDDWRGWSDLVAPDGVIALHDSFAAPGRGIDGAGSVRFTNEIILNDARYAKIEVVDTLTIVRRVTAAPR